MLEQKIRIQFKHKETGAIIGDRLVSAKSEYYAGPKEVHDGPLKIEVDLHTKDDVDQFKAYLDKLVGNLPLEMKVRKYKKANEEPLPEHPVDEMVQKLKKCKDQDEAIAYLKTLNYRFITTDVLTELKTYKEEYKDFFNLKEKHEDYQWMVNVVKEAKDPANDKYNFAIMVGIKIIGKKVDKVQIYLNGHYSETLPCPVAEKSKFNMKEKKKLTVFPQYMTIEERKRWRYFDRKVQTNKPLTKAEDKFYNRWADDIKKLNS
jgi:hypothetical protein